MDNGMYVVRFGTPVGSGSGVVILQDGTARGGDSMMYYSGTYTVNGSHFAASMTAITHSRQPGMTSVFGQDNVSIVLNGTFSGGTASLQGTSPQAPGVKFTATMQKLST